MFTLQMRRFNVLPIQLSIEFIGDLKCHPHNAEPTSEGLNLGQLLFYRSDHWNRHPQTRGTKSRNKNGGIKIFSTEVKKIEKHFKKFPIVFLFLFGKKRFFARNGTESKTSCLINIHFWAIPNRTRDTFNPLCCFPLSGKESWRRAFCSNDMLIKSHFLKMCHFRPLFLNFHLCYCTFTIGR